jgi:hypothetical protein
MGTHLGKAGDTSFFCTDGLLPLLVCPIRLVLSGFPIAHELHYGPKIGGH